MPNASKANLTVIVPVKNEAKNIADCLRSVAWADEVFVVDSQSEDGTREIAQQHGAIVVDFLYSGDWPKKKNWAIKHLPIQNDWILLLDADERVTTELANEIRAVISNTAYDGYYIRWKFMFLGRWMRHCWNDGWMLRLIRTGKGEFEDLGMRGEGGWDNEVHENMLINGPTSKLPSYLLHKSNEDLSRWIQKHNDYSTWDAARRATLLARPLPSLLDAISTDPRMRRRWMKACLIRLPLQPLIVFVYLYVLKRGFLDGAPGWYYCAAQAAHALFINAKEYEKKHPAPQ